jgi:cell division protein FtsW
MINDYQNKRKSPDYLLAIIIFGLVVFGLIMIYSSSVIVSFEKVGHGYHYLTQQAISAGIGILAWIFLSRIDYHVYRKYNFWFLLTSLLLLFLVFIPFLNGEEDIKRWIFIGGLNFQPSEIVKLFFIIYLSGWLSQKGEQVKSFKKGFLPFLVILMAFAGLIVAQPDLGTAGTLAFVGLSLYFLSGARLSHLFMTIGLGVGSLYLAIISAPYRLSRLTTFLNPEANPTGSGYQLRNALIALGSGGWLGRGFGNSSQKYLYLPEAHTDSIFAIIGEELGLARSVLVMVAFILIAWRGLKIASEAPDQFGKLLAGGITIWLVFQAFINLGAILGVVPLTGITLPFISYGGSSLVISLASIGILMNVSKQGISS